MDVEVRVLGRFEVVVDGCAVDAGAWGRRHAAWLVKVLALAPGHRLHREQLVDRLWPDLDLDAAAPRLHKAVHYARRAMGTATAIEVTGSSLALAPGADVSVDAARFRAAATAALAGADVAAAARALDGYGGELLPDDRYEPWTEPERESLRLLWRDLLRLLGRWDVLRDDDPLDETAYLGAARAAAARGDRAGALRELDRLAAVLDTELGVAPSDEAAALRAELEAAPARPSPAAGSAATARGLRSPVTRYADSGSHAIAYQVVGDGPGDIVFVPGFVSNVDLQWELPGMADFFGRLGELGRLIVFDKRATGLSERPPLDALPTLEERMDDVRAVMDAAGSERATIFGISEGGPMAALFAATYPERVERLVIYGSFPRRPFGERAEPVAGLTRKRWGTGGVFARLAPSWAADDATMRFLARYERHSATPAVASGIVRLADQIDVSATLAGVGAPTLVLHRRGDQVITADRGRALAEAIPGARLELLDGDDHLVYVDGDDVLDRVAAFLAGPGAAAPPDRALATILVADAVDSTGHATALGDRAWREVLGRLVDASHQVVVQHRGTVRSVAGDGLLATFDGPARAVRCAGQLHRAAATFGVELRCGIHTAEVELVGDDVVGIGVHVAARVGAAAEPGRTYVTRTVRDLVAGSGLLLTPCGSHELKGIDEPWELYATR